MKPFLMSHKEKTLSERLAELANPTPQFVDPEDEYNEGEFFTKLF